MIITKEIKLNTEGELNFINITDKVDDIIRETSVRNGACLLFTKSSTSTIAIMEFESGLVQDMKTALERLFPKNIPYEHEKKWHDGNGHSHVRATFMKPDLYIPIVNGSLALGTWQQIVFIELDIRQRDRTIILQVIS